MVNMAHPDRTLDWERKQWTADPRGADLEDSELWNSLLARAYAIDADDPNGLFGALHGLRCCGAALVVDRRGVRLVKGELGDEYALLRKQYLMPHRDRLRRLLQELTEDSQERDGRNAVNASRVPAAR